MIGHINKVRDRILGVKERISWRLKIGAAAAAVILVLGAVWWLFLPLPSNYETKLPAYPHSYSATPLSCVCQEGDGCRLSLGFRSLEPAQKTAPEHRIVEDTRTAQTDIVFDRVSEINGQFDYEQITKSPLIDSVDYRVENGKLVIKISRKGAYLPARIEITDATAVVIMEPAAKDFPVISNQKPAQDSAAFPAWHSIGFDATLAAPLKTATVFFQGKPMELDIAPLGPNNYRITFARLLEIDNEYTVRVIVADDTGRTAVDSWSFAAQIPSAVALGKDRFKYLGWWGEINSDGVAVRKGVASASDKVGTLSSANRVKVLKEVYGEWINGKNLWYQIDGGAYPGAYVFSDYVTPMAQPAPPQNFTIPDGVKEGEKWIDVDLAKKVMTLFNYDKPVFATYVAIGRKGNETQAGTFRVWYKLYKTEMRGGPPLHSYRYDLKNIPWTMFYNDDYAIHGTYWHDRFGTQQSAGCTNMTQNDAKFIFENTLPIIPSDKVAAFAKDNNPGTVVHNHY
ncbi:MAG: L,D-transpeptidase family protein [Candidatus Pacebacteria bacterium]|jgi:lipoprotein-anchoring transpeptidase ErfK/SrfK|nr:L,D-transpeptidase family protein [Candidatus Paceibacterota bacterium]